MPTHNNIEDHKHSQNPKGGAAWWREAVVYQVYLRSFADGNGDGIGDLAGLRSRLGYLAELGVDAIWVNPWYASPLRDGGYDVADYYQIHPDFGTVEDAKALIEEAAEYGIRVLADLVPNHTSSDHAWFVEALAAEPGSSARERYHFREGRGQNGEEPPNNWQSLFGGPAWTPVGDGTWYLHLFDRSQPDLNWTNPEVRAAFEDILRFWLDLGVAGFRVDVAPSMFKDPNYADLGNEADRHAAFGDDQHPFWDREELHELIASWRKILDEYPDTMMVAEAHLAWERLARYLREGEYHQVFAFDFLDSQWNREVFEERAERVVAHTFRQGAKPAWTLANHDVVRAATRYALGADVDSSGWLLDGDRELLNESQGVRRARAAALFMLALPGAMYIYQGDELGLGEVWDLPFDVLEDPIWERSSHTRKGRDGCRVPLPWTKTGPSLGFGEAEGWLPQPEGWSRWSAEAQEGMWGSTLEVYRRAIKLRREFLAGVEDFGWEETEHPGLLAFRRGAVRCYMNFGPPVEMPAGEALVASADIYDSILDTDTTVWVLETE